MRLNKAEILAIALIVLILSGTASSEAPWEWVYSHTVGWVIDQIKSIPVRFRDWFMNAVIVNIQKILGLLKDIIMWNPDPDDIKPMVDDFMEILIPVYAMIIIILGIYIIFISTTPAGRARAKSIFWKILLSMVLVSLSLEIFKILLGISEALALRMLAGTITTDFPQFEGLRLMNPATVFFLLIGLCIILIITAIVTAIRCLIVLLACAIFPFTLFLYFFEFTKDIGSKLLRYSIAAIFTQPVQALMLAITIISMDSVGMQNASFSVTIAHIFLVSGGTIMIALAPLIMLGLMKWIGGALAGIGIVVSFVHPVLGSAMVAAGSIAAGMGPGGLIAGGTAYGLSKTYMQAAGIRTRGMERRARKRMEKREKKEEKRRKKVMKQHRPFSDFDRSWKPPEATQSSDESTENNQR
ncbi:MAG: hypothetical protein DRO89_00065 [Candidatus Altiarchaeales archaeon]|nr:MAG: hypothetical protein DRO89_00065 [Candidatus Altiarchaeales archaeon]